ncbi:hypothetical protein KAI32_04065 [Candidatus Pacearchaeota archaeon]|nr:hypothetical protein [Candidatus Pacearchaeota archaeon]
MIIGLPWWIYPILVWTLIWKCIGAWKSARNNQLIWFVSFFVFNTVGILPIIYLVWFQQDQTKKVSKKLIKKKVVKKSRL